MFLRRQLKKIARTLGPGVVTGGSDNDPAGIVTYTTAGALFGYATLWVLVILTPIMIVLQEMAGRIALVQKKGLAKIIKEHYGFPVAAVIIIVLAIANIATIAADLAGVASVLGMITGVSFLWFIVPVALTVTGIIIFENYHKLKALFLLFTFMLVLYIFSSVLALPNWEEVAKGFFPSYNHSTLLIGVIVGIIGTTISPYLLFWQASEEVEEHKKLVKVKELEEDTITGMIWSNVIAAFIIIAAGATLFIDQVVITSVNEAALALRPVAGEWTYLLFSIGLIASGFLALPVLSGSTAYAVAELFNWREGLNKKLHLAKGFYFVITASLLLGALIAFLPINPMEALFYTQILNGLLMPFLLVVLLLLANNRRIMGSYTNGRIKNTICIISLVLITLVDVVLILDLFGWLA